MTAVNIKMDGLDEGSMAPQTFLYGERTRFVCVSVCICRLEVFTVLFSLLIPRIAEKLNQIYISSAGCPKIICEVTAFIAKNVKCS